MKNTLFKIKILLDEITIKLDPAGKKRMVNLKVKQPKLAKRKNISKNTKYE